MLAAEVPVASASSLAGAGVCPLVSDVPLGDGVAAASAARRSGVNGAAASVPDGPIVPTASAVFPWSWFAAVGADVDEVGTGNIAASATEAIAAVAAALGSVWPDCDGDFEDAGGLA